MNFLCFLSVDPKFLTEHLVSFGKHRTFATEKAKRPCRCDWETHQINSNTEVASPFQWRATPVKVSGYFTR